MEFDYFLCMDCGVVVNGGNRVVHKDHGVIGEMFVIKSYKKKKQPGLISQSVINAEQDKINEERWEKRQARDEKRKLLEQQRFEYQIPSGDIIVNLLEVKN